MIIGGERMEKKQNTLTQDASYTIGNGNYIVSRVFKSKKPLNNVIVETITSKKLQSHN